MTGAELKKLISDSAVVYASTYDSDEDPVELMAEDVEALADGDIVLYLPEEDDEEEEEDDESLPVGEEEEVAK